MLITNNSHQTYFYNNSNAKTKQKTVLSSPSLSASQAPTFKGGMSSAIKNIETRFEKFGEKQRLKRDFKLLLAGLEQGSFIAIGNNFDMAKTHVSDIASSNNSRIHLLQTDLIDGCILLRRTNWPDLRSLAGNPFGYEITGFTQKPFSVKTNLNPFGQNIIGLGDKLNVNTNRLTIATPNVNLGAWVISANQLARAEKNSNGHKSIWYSGAYVDSLKRHKSEVVNPDVPIKSVEPQATKAGPRPAKAEQKKETPPKVKNTGKDKITFADVGGMDKLKDEFRQTIIYPYKEPEMYSHFGKTRPKGVLLVGPSGCGKTLFIKAVVNEINAAYRIIKGGELRGGLWGAEEENMRQVFSQAKSNPHKPFAIVFDEIDAAVQNRAAYHAQNTGGTTQFTTLMDEITEEDNIIVFGMTNCPENMDIAAIRRFDFTREVPFPDQKSCEQILEIESRKTPLSKSINIPSLAENLAENKFSGDDIHKMIQHSIDIMMERTGLTKKIIQGQKIDPKNYRSFSIENSDIEIAKKAILDDRAIKNKGGYIDRSHYS